MLQKIKNLFQNSEMRKKLVLSIAVTSTIVFSIFYFEIAIDSLVEFAVPVEIDVTTTINIH